MTLGQGPLMSPSVFNFFMPTYARPARSATEASCRPSSRSQTSICNTTVTNYFYTQIFMRNSSKTGLGSSMIMHRHHR